MKRRLASLAVVLLLAACAHRPPPSEGQATLTVVAITDFHGALDPSVLRTADGQALEVGGAALMSAYVARLRERAPGPLLLVDAGDMFQGSLVSNLSEGAAVLRFYDALGVSAATLGNHEFDYGPEGEKPIAVEPGDDPRGALKARIAEASFPFLAVNVRQDDGTLPPWLRASALLEMEGMKVGVVGAAGVDTPLTTVRANLTGLHFPEPLPLVIEEARRLRADGAAAVVVVYHGGTDCRPGEGEDLSGCRPGPLVDLVQGLPEGLVDVVVGAHTHGGAARRHGRTAVLQAYARGQALAWAEVGGGTPPRAHGPLRLCGAVVEAEGGPTCDAAAVKIAAGAPRPATFLGGPIAPDARMDALLAEDRARGRALQERSLGIVLPEAIAGGRHGQSDLGVLVTDAFRGAAPEADAAMTNAGGLRADLPAGPLTYGAVFEALPFENRLALLEVDGRMVRRIVELGHAGGHGALQWSGLRFEADGCEVGAISIGGAPLEADRRYVLATNDYLAGGGSGFERLGIPEAQVSVRWELPFLRDVVAGALENDGPGLLAGLEAARKAPRQVLRGRCTGRRDG